MKIFLLSIFLSASSFAFSQTDSLAPAFKRYPTLPPLTLLRADSSKFTKADLPKNKAVALLLFNPDCEHCQHEAATMAANAERLKAVQFVFVTTAPLARLTPFAETYGLAGLPNAVVTKELHYILIPFFDVRSFPFLAFYDKNGKLVFTHEGSRGMEKLLERVGK